MAWGGCEAPIRKAAGALVDMTVWVPPVEHQC